MVIRSVVVEDHALVGSALCRALGAFEEVDVLALATSVDEAAEVLRRLEPHVALLDLRLGRDRSIDHLYELRSASPDTRFLVVTAWATEHGLDQALDAGAHGLLSKSQPLTELVDGLRRVHAGELVVCPELLPSLVQRATATDSGSTVDGRDVEVLELLADARSTEEIARRLCMSEHTVRNRIRTAMAKLGVHSRVEAVSEAMRRGLVLPLEPDLSAAC